MYQGFDWWRDGTNNFQNVDWVFRRRNARVDPTRSAPSSGRARSDPLERGDEPVLPPPMVTILGFNEGNAETS